MPNCFGNKTNTSHPPHCSSRTPSPARFTPTHHPRLRRCGAPLTTTHSPHPLSPSTPTHHHHHHHRLRRCGAPLTTHSHHPLSPSLSPSTPTHHHAGGVGCHEPPPTPHHPLSPSTPTHHHSGGVGRHSPPGATLLCDEQAVGLQENTAHLRVCCFHAGYSTRSRMSE